MKYIQDPQIGDIWITIIPKIETKNNKISNVILERRPCLIIDNGHGFIIEKNSDYLGMKITTQNKKNKKEIRNWFILLKGERKMIKILLIIILSPVAIFCGMLSIAIMWAILNKIKEKVMNCSKTTNNISNNRDDKKC